MVMTPASWSSGGCRAMDESRRMNPAAVDSFPPSKATCREHIGLYRHRNQIEIEEDIPGTLQRRRTTPAGKRRSGPAHLGAIGGYRNENATRAGRRNFAYEATAAHLERLPPDRSSHSGRCSHALHRS